MTILPKIITTAFAAGLITMFLTAHYYTITVGHEVWVEISLVLVLTVVVWKGVKTIEKQ